MGQLYSRVIARLKKIKAEKGVTNEVLSEKSGVSLGTVNKLFAGSIGSIKLDTLLLLAEALDVAVEELLQDVPTPSRPVEKPRETEDNFGFVRVGVASPKIKVGDVRFNAEAIIKTAEQASLKGVKILTLPELCLTGYTCGDLFYQQTLISGAEEYISVVAERTRGLGLLLIFGAPIRKEGRIYNCGVVCFEGEILALVPKSYLPSYNEFYDKRQFNPSPEQNGSVEIKGKKYPFGKNYIFVNSKMPTVRVGVEVCEDLWVAEPPSIKLAVNGANIIANLSCSDETVGKAEYRRSLVSVHSAKLNCAYLYANAGDGESTADMVFSGHSIICDSGKILKESELFKSGLIFTEIDTELLEFERSKTFNYNYPAEGGVEKIYFDMPVGLAEITRKYKKTPFVPTASRELNSRAELILNLQAHALKKRLEHIRAKTVVLGISGGLDSTLALLVCVRAFDLLGLDRKGIYAITMPCFGTTSRTYNNACDLTTLLGCTLQKVDIKEAVLEHFKNIGHDPSVTDVTYENSQARERTQVLMDLSNRYGGIVIGTGDLSELALGWATYNGDHMSMYGVNSSIPKTLIRHVIEYEKNNLNSELKRVLQDILDTPVSPELLPHDNDTITQKTEDVVGPYVLHDFFLYHAVRNGFKPSKIYYIANNTFEGDFREETIYKWLCTFFRRFFTQQFKRSCLPDGVKIGSVSLSPRGDWRMPSDATNALWQEDLENIRRIKRD